tara:strand:+ start:382 stop:1671 length:1290 start_codon:yes stop_codon:yes gene_type:complete
MAFKLRNADHSPLSKSAGVPVSFQSPLNQKSEIEARRAAAQTAKAARETADAEKYVSKEVDVKGGRMSNKTIRKAAKFISKNATTDSSIDTAVQGGEYSNKTGNIFTRLAGKDVTKRSGTGSYTTVGDLGTGEALSGKERRQLKKDVKSTLKEGGKGVTVEGSEVTKGTTQTKTIRQSKKLLAEREARSLKNTAKKAASAKEKEARMSARNAAKESKKSKVTKTKENVVSQKQADINERRAALKEKKASKEVKSGSAANYGTPLLQGKTDSKAGWTETGRTSTTRKGKNEAGVSGTFTDVNVTEGKKTPGTKTPRTKKEFSTDPTEKAKQKQWIKDNPKKYIKIKEGKTTPPKNETRSNLNTTFVPDKPKPTPPPKTPPKTPPTPKKKKPLVLDSGGSSKSKRRKGLKASSGGSSRSKTRGKNPCKTCN